MTTYTVTDTQLQELNVLINEGGQIPSAVNAATGKTAEFLDQNKVPEAKASNLKASQENDKSGAAWSNVQAWHDAVKGQEPPVEPPAPGTVIEVPAPQAAGNLTIEQMFAGVLYTYQLGFDATNTSYSRPGGWCEISWGSSPGNRDTGGQAGIGTAIIFGTVPKGSWVTMYVAPASSTPVDSAKYSAQIAH